jgi:hypothetical protein
MPWCINKNRECCQECAAEGKFRYLEPETTVDWDTFRLPPLSELLEMSHWARLAVLWMALWYLQQAATRDV